MSRIPLAHASSTTLVLFFLLNFATSVGAAEQASGAVPQPAEFGVMCAVCHGGDGSGTDRAPALLNNRWLRSQSETDLITVIKNGRNNMPSFSALPAEQIQSLAHYVHSLNAAAFDMKPPGDIAAGAAVFNGNGRCSECHTAEGRGGTNGPDLSAIGKQLSLADAHSSGSAPSNAHCQRLRAGRRVIARWFDFKRIRAQPGNAQPQSANTRWTDAFAAR